MYNSTVKYFSQAFFTTVLVVGQNLVGTEIVQGTTERNRDLENYIISPSLGAELGG